MSDVDPNLGLEVIARILPGLSSAVCLGPGSRGLGEKKLVLENLGQVLRTNLIAILSKENFCANFPNLTSRIVPGQGSSVGASRDQGISIVRIIQWQSCSQ